MALPWRHCVLRDVPGQSEELGSIVEKSYPPQRGSPARVEWGFRQVGAESVSESSKMDLPTLVKKYLEIAGGYERPVHLSVFALGKADTEKVVAALDEDYQISRYMQLSRERDEALADFPRESRVYLINGYEVSHLSFHPDIQKLL